MARISVLSGMEVAEVNALASFLLLGERLPGVHGAVFAGGFSHMAVTMRSWVPALSVLSVSVKERRVSSNAFPVWTELCAWALPPRPVHVVIARVSFRVEPPSHPEPNRAQSRSATLRRGRPVLAEDFS